MPPLLKSAALLLSTLLLLGIASCPAQQLDATLHVRFLGPSVPLSPDTPLVVWLSPVGPALAPARPPHSFRMVQKNKQFAPHLLVVPVGSTVEFPNLDPFFHNVFSLFNGRRFDLGLYETGQSQAVKLPREGVSYIFCNIHPEMGGVIVSLATPFYTVSPSGTIVLHAVPPGTYRLGLWSELASTESLNNAARSVTLSLDNSDLGTVTLQSAPRGAQPHPNKFGDLYPASAP